MTYLGFIILGMLAAGIFGALHDQISYTVSLEYFTRFKFRQFHLFDAAIPERVRAAQVGFLASWWMGLPLGLLAGIGGFMHASARQMREALFLSIPVLFGFVLAFALGGLAYGYVQTRHIDVATYRGWYVPDGVAPRPFLCAGYMHNAAYLGGVLAIPVAWALHVVLRLRRKATAD
jgi:hypothetical protein